MMTNRNVVGAALDLHKAFNTLHRGLLQALCEKLGLSAIWDPYNKALSGLQRYFSVQEKLSPAAQSVTGVPEGCPLAVVMMAVITWSFTNALSHKFPGCTLSSYVGD